MYLGHWLGDIHQKLHISYADDRGEKYVLLERGFGCNKNLHSVWDKCIPENLMKEANIEDQLQFGDFLHSQITGQQRQKWSSEIPLSTWVNESYQITRLENVQYCVLDCHSSKYDYDNYEQNDGEEKRY